MLLEITGGLLAVVVCKVMWSRLTFQTNAKLQHYSDKNGGKPPKRFSSVPGPRGLPFIGNVLDVLIFNPIEGKSHEWLEDRFRSYGPIVHEKILTMELVLIYDRKLIDLLSEMDGKYPRVIMVEPWRIWREVNSKKNGFFTSTDAEWKKLRTAWNKVILNSSEVYSYLDNLNEVQEAAMATINSQKDKDGRHPALDKFLFSWALENIGVFLFETRIGCFDEQTNEEAQKFIQSVNDIFATVEMLLMFPDWFNRVVFRSHHKKHGAAWTFVSRKAEEAVDSKIRSMTKDTEEGIVPTGFLASVIARHELDPEEIYSCVSELMMAAVDTTSNTSHFALYELARHPEVQAKLYEEILEVTKEQPPTGDHLRRMTYLQAILREVMRLYPVGMGATRVLAEDAVLGGYLIPAKTSIWVDTWVNGRSDKNFSDPEEFRPERWFESDSKLSVQTSASVPFGIGSRSCIGRKVAETEIFLLMIHILLKFELRYGGKGPVKLATRSVLVPSEPIDILFINRE